MSFKRFYTIAFLLFYCYALLFINNLSLPFARKGPKACICLCPWREGPAHLARELIKRFLPESLSQR